ncbi:MAG: NAD(P)H-dependent oxidoreductase [Ardenticatenaceae bacterium]|nr:NAD(P)H-dependent oxidoreductase [Ardenticatenaceae bacterium]
MTNNIHILGFAGSLRQKSYNRALLRNAQTLLPAHTTLEIFDLAAIPFFDADVEAIGTPPSVLHFRDRMRQADALLIASPEYNYSITGILKNAIDWASRKGPEGQSPLDDKPVAIMGAGGRMGTVRSQMHLRDILIHNNNIVVPSPEVTISFARQEFDEELNLINERYRDQIGRLLQNLAALTHRLQMPLPTAVHTATQIAIT